MVADTGIEIKRLNNWFVNNRIRFWKPRFEAMQKQLENKKRKLSKPKENSVSSETSSVPVSKVPTREMPNTLVEARQEDTKVSEDVVSTPRLGLSHLVYTAINNTFATVSDDDSCSCSSSSSIDSSSKSNSKKTSMLHRCRKRQRREIENDDIITSTPVESPPRFKNTCNDVEQWKHACLNSFSAYSKLDDTNLPSLDEAVQLFGYSVVASK